MIFFFFHNQFAFGEQVHVHSVFLKVWFVKCSKIANFTLKTTLQSHKKKSILCVIRATRKPMLFGIQSNKKTYGMVFRATRKLMFCIQSNKGINAKGNQSNKEIHAPVSGTNFFGNLGFELNFPTKLEKNKNATLMNALIGSIFWNKNISCHNTFKKNPSIQKNSKNH